MSNKFGVDTEPEEEEIGVEATSDVLKGDKGDPRTRWLFSNSFNYKIRERNNNNNYRPTRRTYSSN